MKVVHFHRKRSKGNFSIETLFEQIRGALTGSVDVEAKELRFISKGLFRRIYISIEAALAQKDINHITGDIHFIALFLRSKRTVLTIHDLGFMNNRGPISRFVLRLFWIVIPVNRSAIVTTVSQNTQKDLLRYVHIDPSKLRVIHNPISHLFMERPKVFNKKKPRILQIGTKPNKNLPRLLIALRGINCFLDIVGEVDEMLLSRIEDSGVDFAISAGLTKEEMIQKYGDADILAYVSTYEGFGLPIIEANAVGRVVVTGNVSSMPEIASDAAHLVDPLDIESIKEGILRVIHDDIYREDLIEKGYNNRKRFNLDSIAAQYEEVYHLIASNDGLKCTSKIEDTSQRSPKT